jgi:hypothetical protein
MLDPGFTHRADFVTVDAAATMPQNLEAVCDEHAHLLRARPSAEDVIYTHP